MKTLDNFIIEKLKLSKNTEINNTQEYNIYDPEGWNVDDVLLGIYSYSMTIPYFFKILNRTKKSFTIVELKEKLVSGHYNGIFSVVPETPHKSYSKPINVRVNKFGKVSYKNMTLRLWDGGPVEGCDLD